MTISLRMSRGLAGLPDSTSGSQLKNYSGRGRQNLFVRPLANEMKTAYPFVRARLTKGRFLVEDPQGRRIGRYITKTYDKEVVCAFVPPPLPPDPPVRLEGLQQILEQANQAVGRLDGLASILPDLSLFIYTYVRKEAVLSSQIEGTQSSLSDFAHVRE